MEQVAGRDAAEGQAPKRKLTTADEEKSRLEEWFPGWRVWYVHRVVDHTVWCARRGTVLLNEDSPEALIAAIKRAEGES